jgi:hypothetical protein
MDSNGPNRPVRELLDLAFSLDIPGGGSRWVTLPPSHWFCQYCDSQCVPKDFAVASLRRDPLGRRRIVWQPCEWRHDFQDAGFAVEEQHRVANAVRHHVNAPGLAATWNIQRQMLQIIKGSPTDWRVYRR